MISTFENYVFTDRLFDRRFLDLQVNRIRDDEILSIKLRHVKSNCPIEPVAVEIGSVPIPVEK